MTVIKISLIFVSIIIGLLLLMIVASILSGIREEWREDNE